MNIEQAREIARHHEANPEDRETLAHKILTAYADGRKNAAGRNAINQATTAEKAFIESRLAKAEATVRRQREALADQYERLRAALKELNQAKAWVLQYEVTLANAESRIAELTTLLNTVRHELAGSYTGSVRSYVGDQKSLVFNVENAVQQIDKGLEVTQ